MGPAPFDDQLLYRTLRGKLLAGLVPPAVVLVAALVSWVIFRGGTGALQPGLLVLLLVPTSAGSLLWALGGPRWPPARRRWLTGRVDKALWLYRITTYRTLVLDEAEVYEGSYYAGNVELLVAHALLLDGYWPRLLSRDETDTVLATVALLVGKDP